MSDSARPSTRPPHSKDVSLRILLAEDDRALRTLLASRLLAAGHIVWQAESGTELASALSSIAQTGSFVPDLLISDVRMPGATGIDVLLALRRARWNTPVILMSAFVDDIVRETAIALRAHVVLDKPFEMDTLLRSVNEVIAMHHAA